MTNSPTPIFDGHNDALLNLYRSDTDDTGTPEYSVFERHDANHLDLPRAREGNFAGGFFAAFVSTPDADYETRETDEGHEIPYADPISHERAKAHTYDMLAHLYRVEAESEGEFRVVRTPDDLRECFDDDAVAAIAHLEGAEAVAPDLSNLDFLYAAGVRSIGLVWSRPTEFAHGVPFKYPATPDIGPGLTDAGRELVRACNDRGILVDLAHLNAAGFWDVADISADPLVVSHTAAHELCPATRNLTDDQIDAVADSGGVVGITFAVTSLREDGRKDTDTSISTLVDHVEYVADRAGVEHVALGSDFDGATIPDSVGDVTGLPDVVAEIRDRGFDEDEVAKIAHENWVRVVEETWG
ncbi:dipeptidase [Halorussus amylolyticus]|uniref:dipeptidase n=1 Tax=Halorussus amylolyticus TaxID=1126242 RepID=UPI0010521A82|nr:dipeptidase [Halorussus amylolyticus]